MRNLVRQITGLTIRVVILVVHDDALVALKNGDSRKRVRVDNREILRKRISRRNPRGLPKAEDGNRELLGKFQRFESCLIGQVKLVPHLLCDSLSSGLESSFHVTSAPWKA